MKGKGIYISLVLLLILGYVGIMLLSSKPGVSVKVEERKMSLVDSNNNEKIDIGDSVILGNEKFYVISSDDNKTKLISYYNINLSTLRQSDESLGYKVNTFNRDAIEYEKVNEYLDKYRNYFKSIDIKDVSLISKDMLSGLGINFNNYNSGKEWLFNSSYWVDGKNYVRSDSFYGKYSKYKDVKSEYGIRPLVSISKIDKDKLVLVNDLNGNGIIDQYDIVSINDEEFRLINEDDNNVYLFAKYNLNLDLCKQDSESLGFVVKEENNDTIVYSNESAMYDSSIVKDYVNKYHLYLENEYNVNILDSLLMNEEILENLGCSIEENSCINAPSWVYNTSYWLDYRTSLEDVWGVLSTGEFNMDIYSNDSNYGIRPIIVVETSKIK